MKKIIFAAAAALATFFSANVMAEETEYNMVITLQNGTTITLGHNDIKNITFNGEEISISGNAATTIEEHSSYIEELWMSLEQTQNFITQVINSTDDKFAETNNEVEELWKSLNQTNEMISQVLNSNAESVTAVSDELQSLYEAIYAEGGLSDQMSQYYNANLAEINDMKERVEYLEYHVTEELPSQVNMYINALTADFDEVKTQIADLLTTVAMLQERVTALESK